jgi:phosphatidylglycerol:prolipoprotein diacylglycerol transferase
VRPILYDLWGIPISAFGVFLLLAFLVAISVARGSAQRRLGVDPNWTLDLALYAIIAGIVGGRIGYIAANLGQFIVEPVKMVTIWRDGGLVYYGALAAALLLVRGAVRSKQISCAGLLDAFAPALVLGYGVAMIGALLHGLFAGRPTGVPWAIELFLERRHPTQIYLMLAMVAILAILRAQRGRQLASGALFVLALFLQAVARFAVDFFVEAPAVVGPLTAGQLASGAVVLVTAVLLVRLQRQAPVIPPDPAAEAPA